MRTARDFGGFFFNSTGTIIKDSRVDSLFKIIAKPSRKVQFSSEKQEDMSDDGT